MGLVGLDFGGVRVPLGFLLGATSPAFGSSGAALDLSWTLVGCLLGNWWALLGVSRLVRAASQENFGSLGLPGLRFSRVWGRAGLGFGSLWAHVLACILLHPVLRNQKLFFMQQPHFFVYMRFAFFPSGAAVSAQHME